LDYTVLTNPSLGVAPECPKLQQRFLWHRNHRPMAIMRLLGDYCDSAGSWIWRRPSSASIGTRVESDNAISPLSPPSLYCDSHVSWTWARPSSAPIGKRVESGNALTPHPSPAVTRRALVSGGGSRALPSAKSSQELIPGTHDANRKQKKHGRGLPTGWAGCVSACVAPAAGRLRGLSVRARALRDKRTVF